MVIAQPNSTDRAHLAQARFEEALRHHQAGELAAGERLYLEAIGQDPGHADSLHLLGVLQHQLGQDDRALELINRALALRDEAPACWNNLGVVLEALGRRDEAAAAYERAINLAPDHADAHNNRGNLFRHQGNLMAAELCYRRAVELHPAHPHALDNLTNLLRQTKRLRDAAVFYQTALEAHPNSPALHNHLGIACYSTGNLDRAEASYRQALALSPGYAEAHNNLGALLRDLGRRAEAQSAYEAAIAADPGKPAYFRNLGEMKRFTEEDPRLRAMEHLAEAEPGLAPDDQIELHFALAKAYEDLGRHEDSFRHLLRGSSAKRGQIAYDETTQLALFEKIRTAFTPELVTQKALQGERSELPLFIVGMPRSGTSLIEQILASHPKVHGAGEIEDFWDALATVGVPSVPVGQLPDFVSSLERDSFETIGRAYLASVRERAPRAERIVNKLPANFMHLGFIHLALPDTRIIHVQRDPLDTCFSCFSKLFTEGHNYSYDLGELGRYYAGYRALMEHWRAVLPALALLELRYEEVVTDLEKQARRILEFCGLDWDPACLDFHKTVRPVQTASAVQVRQPIYDSSIGRARRYAAWLGPLAKGLQQGQSQ